MSGNRKSVQHEIQSTEDQGLSFGAMDFAGMKEDFHAFTSALFGQSEFGQDRLEMVQKAWQTFENQVHKLENAGKDDAPKLHRLFEEAGDHFTEAVTAYKAG